MLHQRKGRRGLGKGYWGSGGGHLERGESLKEAALRELSEEAGDQIKVKNLRFLGVMNFTELQPKHYVDVTFVADWLSGEPTNNAPPETTDWQWFSLEILPSPLFPPVEKYLKAIQTGQNFFDSSFKRNITGGGFALQAHSKHKLTPEYLTKLAESKFDS